MTPLVHVKPWQFKGRRMERNAPSGRRCDESCTHPAPTPGTKLCLCTVCHEVFGTPRNFDRHRRDGWCLDPAASGMGLSKFGVWRETMDPDQLNRFRTDFREEDDE